MPDSYDDVASSNDDVARSGDDRLVSLARTDPTVALPSARAGDSFENYLYDPQDDRIRPFRGMRYDEFAKCRLGIPVMGQLLDYWRDLYEAPFVGVTSDGTVVPGLYPVCDVPDEFAAPTARMVEAARGVLDLLTDEERDRFCHEVDAPEWRAWSNPEFLVHEVGLRLENLSAEKVAAFVELVRASLSDEGFRRVTLLMKLNGFLGSLVDLPTVLGELSYQVAIYGTPSTDTPWGWQLFGHHVAINVFADGPREVVAPAFMGAEPNVLTATGDVLFAKRQQLALDLVTSLTASQVETAVLYESVRDPRMPEGRISRFDERHLAGAFQDNRVIPYEGLRASELSEDQRQRLLALIEEHLTLLPPGPAAAKVAEVRAHLSDTYLCWIGGTDGVQPFYFRIQSPVLLAEFDHHAGIWLNNEFPALFHIHTTLRYPNGNDYGKAYLANRGGGTAGAR
jgi:hypothetical protein